VEKKKLGGSDGILKNPGAAAPEKSQGRGGGRIWTAGSFSFFDFFLRSQIFWIGIFSDD
jgi:hypothetical protein